MKRLAILIISFFLSLQLFAQNANSGMRDNITAIEITADMAPGLNLYNTLDATGDWVSGLAMETMWGNPYTTFEMVQSMAERGFRTLRIPVSWGAHMGSAPDFVIDKAWMDRVEQVVNYALDNGMYAIVNIHHDDEHFVPTYAKQAEGTDWLEKTWAQIATRFKDYGDYLIFETLNEPRAMGTPEEWTGGSAEHRDVVNAYIQAAVDVIRGTGGNNETRFIMVQQVGANGNPAISDLIIPNNDTNIIVSVHNYSPYSFCLDEAGTSKWGTTAEIEDLHNSIKSLGDHFVANGQAVILGEWGAGNKDNYSDRVLYYEEFTKACKNAGITPIAWIYEFNRKTITWNYPMIEEAIFKVYNENTIEVVEILLNIPQDTIYAGETLQLSASLVPDSATYKDIIWSSNAKGIATIDANGLLKAKARGKVEITATTIGKRVSYKLVVIDTITQTNFLIEAESFDNQAGIQSETCSDKNGGENIGYIENGDWCSYGITIDSTGIYNFTARAASDTNGGEIEISIKNNVVGTAKVDGSRTNGWQDWYTTDPIEIKLDKGEQEIKLTFKGSSGYLFNLNWFDLTYRNPLSVNSNVNDLKLPVVYPNPVKNTLNIEAEFDITAIDIYNYQGQKVQSQETIGTKHQIKIDLPKGIYMLTIYSENIPIKQKIVIE
ncbi:MAG: cellulase family glycosylhydrolase [Prolixibacteraceae bacterium]